MWLRIEGEEERQLRSVVLFMQTQQEVDDDKRLRVKPTSCIKLC